MWFVFMEMLRMETLKNVDFFYAHKLLWNAFL